MSKIYYGDRSSGGSLKHYRTKGSKNGYSKNPNYKAVGQKAKGRWVNGRYVYDQPTNAQSKPANVSQEYWDELQFNTNPNYQSPASKKNAVNIYSDPRYTNKSNQSYTPYMSEEYKEELAWNSGKPYTKKVNQINVKTDPRFKKSTTNTGMTGDPRYFVSGTSKIDKAKVTALSKAGAKNNWQQQANAYRSADEHVNMYAQKRMKDSNENFNALNAAFKKYTYDGAHLRGDDSYKKASKRVSGGSNINSVHNAQTERERSERARKSSKSAINYTDPNTASKFYEGVRADPRFNKSTIKGISGMVYSTIDKPKRAAEIADMKARATKKDRERHPVKYAVNDAKIKVSQTAHKAKKETKKFIAKGKSAVENLLKKFKKKK